MLRGPRKWPTAIFHSWGKSDSRWMTAASQGEKLPPGFDISLRENRLIESGNGKEIENPFSMATASSVVHRHENISFVTSSSNRNASQKNHLQQTHLYLPQRWEQMVFRYCLQIFVNWLWTTSIAQSGKQQDGNCMSGYKRPFIAWKVFSWHSLSTACCCVIFCFHRGVCKKTYAHILFSPPWNQTSLRLWFAAGDCNQSNL